MTTKYAESKMKFEKVAPFRHINLQSERAQVMVTHILNSRVDISGPSTAITP